MVRLLRLRLLGYLAQRSRANPREGNNIQGWRFVSFLSEFWDIMTVVRDHLQETKGEFWVQDLYLGRCWRWIRTPDSQTDSSRRGASTPDSTFSWTIREREKKRKGKCHQLVLRETWEKSPWKKNRRNQGEHFFNDSVKSVWDTSNFPSIFFAILSLFHSTTREVFAW